MRRLAVVLAAALALVPAGSAEAKTFGGFVRDIPTGAPVSSPAMAHAANLSNAAGGPVLHSNRTHLIFWQPDGSGMTFDPGYMSLMETFLAQVAADSHKPTNVYSLSGQYTDGFGPAAYASTYGGAVVATDHLPANGCVEPPTTGPGWTTCLNDEQLQTEIEHVITTDHLPTRATDVYFLVTPDGLGSCIDQSSQSCALGGQSTGYCGYHSQTYDGVLYAVIPYNAVQGHCQSANPRPNGSTADPAISTISHEHNEMVTDPQADAWTDGAGNEDGDLCIQSFGPILGGSGSSAWNEVIHGGHYFLQEEWSNDDGGCAARDESDLVSISVPAHIQAGKRIALTGHASDPDGSIVAFTWWFGDGTPSHRRWHVFRRPGVYKVLLRATDRADNWAFASVTIHVHAQHIP